MLHPSEGVKSHWSRGIS